jgi:hypothetical protein
LRIRAVQVSSSHGTLFEHATSVNCNLLLRGLTLRHDFDALIETANREGTPHNSGHDDGTHRAQIASRRVNVSLGCTDATSDPAKIVRLPGSVQIGVEGILRHGAL